MSSALRRRGARSGRASALSPPLALPLALSLVVAGALLPALGPAPRAGAMPRAQEAAARMEIEPEGARIGEPLTITLRVPLARDETALFPELPAELGDFEIVSRAQPRIVDGPAGVESVLRLGARAWTTGTLRASDVRVRIADADGGLRETRIPGLAYEVHGVLLPDDLVPRPMRPPLEVDLQPVWLSVGLALLFVAGLLAILFWALRRVLSRPVEPPAAPVPAFDPLTARDQAREVLDRIAAMGLLEAGHQREHYALVTDCLRHFLEVVHQVPALERTTRETDAALRAAPRVSARSAEDVLAILREADRVKFAGGRAEPRVAASLIPRVRAVLDRLWAERPRSTAPPGAAQPGPGRGGPGGASPAAPAAPATAEEEAPR